MNDRIDKVEFFQKLKNELTVEGNFENFKIETFNRLKSQDLNKEISIFRVFNFKRNGAYYEISITEDSNRDSWFFRNNENCFNQISITSNINNMIANVKRATRSYPTHNEEILNDFEENAGLYDNLYEKPTFQSSEYYGDVVETNQIEEEN